MVDGVRLLGGNAVHSKFITYASVIFFLGIVPLIFIIITIAWILETKGCDWYESEEVMDRYYKHQESVMRGCAPQCISHAPSDLTEMTIPPVLLLETARRHPSMFED
jgi:hypothetical protein